MVLLSFLSLFGVLLNYLFVEFK